MTINEFSCDRPEVNFSLSRHPALSRLEVGLENVIHLTFFEEFLILLHVLDDPRVKVAVLRRRSSRVLTVPSATGNTIFSIFMGVDTSLALSLRRGVLMRPSPPILQCLRS